VVGRRRLLRVVRLSHHQHSRGRWSAHRHRARLLGTPGQALAPCGAALIDRPVALCLAGRTGPGSGSAPGSGPGHVVLRGQLAADRRRARLLRPVHVAQPTAAHLVAGDRGAVLPVLAFLAGSHAGAALGQTAMATEDRGRDHPRPGPGLGDLDGRRRPPSGTEPRLPGHGHPRLGAAAGRGGGHDLAARGAGLTSATVVGAHRGRAGRCGRTGRLGGSGTAAWGQSPCAQPPSSSGASGRPTGRWLAF
jgi:hypothetical protein